MTDISPQMKALSDRLYDKRSKDAKYDQNMAKKFLKAFGLLPSVIKSTTAAAGSDFGLSYVTSHYSSPYWVALESFKPRKPVDLAAILRGGKAITQQSFWTAWQQLCEDWPDFNYHALVFDYHGDGVGDLVLHNMQNALNPVADTGRITVYFADSNEPDVAVENLNTFLDSFSDWIRL